MCHFQAGPNKPFIERVAKSHSLFVFRNVRGVSHSLGWLLTIFCQRELGLRL